MSFFIKNIDEDLQAPENTLVRPSSLHGDGVLSTVSVPKKDEILFEEAPLLFIQSLINRKDNIICAGCHTFVGSLSMQLDVLCGSVSRQDQEDLDNHSTSSMVSGNPGVGLGTFSGNQLLSPVVLCSHKCGEVYCSAVCGAQHWNRGHCLLCTGDAEQDDPIVQFKVHAVSSNEIFLLVADVFAAVCTAVESLQSEVSRSAELATDLIQKTFGSYVREQWWDAAIAPPGSDPIRLRESLKQLVKESYAMLAAALRLEARGLNHVLTEEFMSRTIGMFEQNNVGVSVQSPLQAFATSLLPGHPSVSHFAGAAQMIADALDKENEEEEDGDWEDMDEDNESNMEEEVECEEEGGDEGMYCMAVGEASTLDTADQRMLTDDPAFNNLQSIFSHAGQDNIFPPVDGAAFYKKICKINHSCEPNVRVKYACYGKGIGIRAQMVSLRPIAEGEELLQSYIDQNMPFEKRQLALRDYGFVCACRKCQEQR